jgi:hypothetical protein
VQGVVIIEATIGVNGKVTDAKVLRSIPLLDARRAGRREAVGIHANDAHNGQPVPVIMTVTVNFHAAIEEKPQGKGTVLPTAPYGNSFRRRPRAR